MKKMSKEDRKTLIEIKTYSREGGKLFPDQLKFVEKMFNEYEQEFSEIDKEIRIESIKKLNPLYGE